MKAKFTFLKSALLFLFILSGITSKGQTRTISGKIADEFGDGLPGVSILIKGTTTGTTTNVEGQYRLSGLDTDDVLIISFVGYNAQEITIGDQTKIDVDLDPDVSQLDEIVVVGYGTQKKTTATGAISTVEPKDLVSQPVSNVGNALVGLVPGISATQYSGEPGNNAATIRIRGVSTLNDAGRDALVVIDGVQQSYSMLNLLDANEIQNISVLKDASATAVYGIRGANGVILVTTRRGKTGKAKISLSYNQGFSKANEIIRPVNSYTYAQFRNEAIANGGNTQTHLLFSEDELWKFQNNRDYTDEELQGMNLTPQQFVNAQNSPALYYGSTNYFEEQFGGSSPQSQTNVNISGGTEDVDYFASVGYFKQDGIFDFDNYGGKDNNSHYDRYNFRANVDIKSIKNLVISADIQGTHAISAGVFGTPGNNHRYWEMNQWLYESAPYKGPGFIDGKLVTAFINKYDPIQAIKGGGGRSPLIEVFNSNVFQLATTNLNSRLQLNYKLDFITEGLSVTATGTYNDMQQTGRNRNTPVPQYTATKNPENPAEILYFGGAVGAETLNENLHTFRNRRYYVEGRINYERFFGNHNVSSVFIANGQKFYQPNLAFRVPEGLLGFAGRATYNFKEKYLAEFNMGYNGSENFPEGKRFGFFPAFSAGWVISNESFFQDIPFFNWLKIRGSYGEVGNDRIGGNRFLYLPSTWAVHGGSPTPLNGYYFGATNGSSLSPYNYGAYEDKIGNPNVTWERAVKRNISVETKFFAARLSYQVDLWDEKRDNILWSLGTVPALVGANLPAANIGKVNNQGYEMQLGWEDSHNGFSYSISGYIAYAKNEIIYRDEAAFEYDWMNETGFSIGQYKGYVSDGFYNSQEEVSNRMYTTVENGKIQPGDLRYVDINGDGQLNASDRVPIGFSNLPLYTFGSTIAFGYKGFDISMLFTGSKDGSFPIRSENLTTPFFKEHGIALQWQYDGRWTPEKVEQGITPTYPRAALDNNTNNNGASMSDFWLVTNDYIKLKNISLGYSFQKLAEKMKLGMVRLYINANNVLLLKSDFIEGIDPEQQDAVDAQRGFVYPLTSSYIGGIKLEF